MKKDYLFFGILIGFLIVLSAFLFIKLQKGPSCPICDDVSVYNEEIEVHKKRIDMLKESENLFIKNLFSMSEGRDNYLSHFDECFIKEKISEKDACIMSFIFETKDYSACFLLSELSLRNSCLSLNE
jgi:hypothetical protein